MLINRFCHTLLVVSAILLALPTLAQPMPKEDVIDVPAIGEGLWVSNVFQTNMVLQRDKPIAVWGWAEPGETVTVTLAGNKANVTTGDDRAWKVELPALAANDQPQTMTIAGKAGTLSLENILIGDVWLLGGQSNMEFPLTKVENGHLEIISANYPQIRVLTIPRAEGLEHEGSFNRVYEWSDWGKRHERKGDWDVCSPEMVSELSAIGFAFARRVHMACGVPIGVIDASRGGTTVEAWTPLGALRAIDGDATEAVLAEWDAKVAAFDPEQDLAARIEKHEQWLARMNEQGNTIPDDRKDLPGEVEPGPIASQNYPSNSFAGMIQPLSGLSIKGAIWHQGYNNALIGISNGPAMYREVFPVLIQAWRENFNDPDMPFGILSLCTEGSPQTLDNYSETMLNNGIHIREAQYLSFLDLYNAGDANVGFVSTYDLRRRWYHPQVKIPAGERIARWALATQYGFDEQLIGWKPPMITGMEVKDGSLIVSFDTKVQDPEDGEMLGFAIAGADRRFHPATATHPEIGKNDRGQMQYDRSKVVLTSMMVPEPVAYRYAWGRSPLANVQASGNRDLPVATQRSDDWPIHTVPLGVLPDDLQLPLERGDWGKLLRELREQDAQRRIREAEQVLEEQTAAD